MSMGTRVDHWGNRNPLFTMTQFRHVRANVKTSAFSETHHLTLGRFTPVHVGHEVLINQVLDAAGQDHSCHTILTTATHGGHKNPLPPDVKVKHLKRAFQTANVEALGKGTTLLHYLSKLYNQGVKHLVMYAGSDRVHGYYTIIHQFNDVKGRHGYYRFDSIKVNMRVGGPRNDAAEGVSGASATKMRKAASSGDEQTFYSMAPSSMSAEHKRNMYNDVRRGLGIQDHSYDLG